MYNWIQEFRPAVNQFDTIDFTETSSHLAWKAWRLFYFYNSGGKVWNCSLSYGTGTELSAPFAHMANWLVLLTGRSSVLPTCTAVRLYYLRLIAAERWSITYTLSRVVQEKGVDCIVMLEKLHNWSLRGSYSCVIGTLSLYSWELCDLHYSYQN